MATILIAIFYEPARTGLTCMCPYRCSVPLVRTELCSKDSRKAGLHQMELEHQTSSSFCSMVCLEYRLAQIRGRQQVPAHHLGPVWVGGRDSMTLGKIP